VFEELLHSQLHLAMMRTNLDFRKGKSYISEMGIRCQDGDYIYICIHISELGIQCHGGDKSGLMNGNEMIYCISMCMSEKKVYPVNL